MTTKKKKKIYYTDYPFTSLGDVAGQQAPIREIQVLNYDGNKYCDILVEGKLENIKWGYIYTVPGRCGDATVIDYKVVKKIKACICKVCAHNMGRSRCKADLTNGGWIVRCNKCKTVFNVSIVFPKKEKEDGCLGS